MLLRQTIAFSLALTVHPEQVKCKENGEGTLCFMNVNLKDVCVSVNRLSGAGKLQPEHGASSEDAEIE